MASAVIIELILVFVVGFRDRAGGRGRGSHLQLEPRDPPCGATEITKMRQEQKIIRA